LALIKRVFISYRRDDTGPVARLIYDRLVRVVSKPNVFFDVSAIRGGEDFKQKIATEITKCDAALVLIGNKWLKETPENQSRIWELDDYVRAEIREALARPILVLPVLVSGAGMPKAEQLPEDVRVIVTKNAMQLRHESFEDDAEMLLTVLLGERTRERPWEKQTSIVLTTLHAFGGAVTAALIVITVALLHFWIFDRALSGSIGTPMTLLMITLSVIAGIWAGLNRAR